MSVVSSSDDKNGDIAGNGGIWYDDGSSDGSDSESDAGNSSRDSINTITRQQVSPRYLMYDPKNQDN
ncbi:hypothetical protein Tco_1399928 [Tanacetum coccineum]